MQSHWRDGHAVTEGLFQWSGFWNRRTDMDLGEILKISDCEGESKQLVRLFWRRQKDWKLDGSW